MAVLLTPPFLQFFDENGDPLSGGKIYSYAAGTTTPKATYTTQEATSQNTNPVILDAAGRAVIFIQGSYRFDIFDANDELVRTVDNVTSFSTIEGSNDPYFQSFSGTGSQTSFTVSQNLGSDSEAVQIFISTPVQSYVDNGDFATDTAWTKGAGWTIGAGVATAAGAISTAISQPSPKTVVNGRAYRVTYTITRSAGGLIPSIGGSNGTERTASGTYTEIIIAGSTQTIAFTGNAFTGTLDAVTIENIDTVGFQVQDPSTYTVNGTSVEFAIAPPSGTNNIYVFAPTQLVGAAVSAADAAISAAAAAEAAVAIVENQKLVWMGNWSAGTYNQNEAVYYNGSSWIVTAASTTDTPDTGSADWDLLALKGADGTGGIVLPTGGQIGYEQRASGVGTYGWFGGAQTVSSGATVDLEATTARIVTITGTTTITSFGTPPTSADWRFIRFEGVLTLTHNAGSLSLPGATNITTAVGDEAIFRSRAGSGWRCISYSKVSGKAIIGPSAADITDSTATGRSILTAADAAAVRTAGAIYDEIIDQASSLIATVDSTSTAIPLDDTIPQNTEGKEYTTVSITPKSASNRVLIRATLQVSTNTNSTYCSAAIFRDSVVNALAAATARVVTAGSDINTIVIEYLDSPATTSAVTYKLRFGPSSGTGYVNQGSAGRLFGGVMMSGLVVQEIRG